MITDEEPDDLLEIEKRLGHAMAERNGPHARFMLEFDVPALLKDVRELREKLAERDDREFDALCRAKEG